MQPSDTEDLYAQHQQVCQIPKKMMEIMTREVQRNDLKEVKSKMLKKPKFELGKLMELHSEDSSSGKDTGHETGAKVERVVGYESPVKESA
ncbi:40S ribosomal protein S3-1 [Saguinus oedipus]|uniref:40S ribosomal protein S3-1 n=1 Tax=Saguinus oedipus TaxID=9490 RepID=A0ABQ9UP87_SAGOE|nr:40S ribosomal protein S3-1 [Saguinus oedipus]